MKGFIEVTVIWQNYKYDYSKDQYEKGFKILDGVRTEKKLIPVPDKFEFAPLTREDFPEAHSTYTRTDDYQSSIYLEETYDEIKALMMKALQSDNDSNRRDRFAGLAMQGLLANSGAIVALNKARITAPEHAVIMADSLIAALNKEEIV